LPYIPIFESEVQRRAVKPRLLIVETGVNISDISDTESVMVFSDGPNQISVEQIPFSYFHKANTGNFIIDSLTNSLAFSRQQIQDSLSEPISDGSFSDIQAAILSPTIELLRVKIATYELLDFDYSVPIFLDLGQFSGYYFLSNAEGFNGRDSVNCFLLKIQ
jgi:hypothetical protein